MTNIPGFFLISHKYVSCIQLIYALLQLKLHSNCKFFNKFIQFYFLFIMLFHVKIETFPEQQAYLKFSCRASSLPLLAFKIMFYGVIFSAIYIFSPCQKNFWLVNCSIYLKNKHEALSSFAFIMPELCQKQ